MDETEQKDLIRQVVEARALRWSGYKPPTPQIPPEKGYVNGWRFHHGTVSSYTVPCWMNDTMQGAGYRYGTGHRFGPRIYAKQYPTQREALIALRLDMEQDFAKKLAKVDAAIAMIEVETQDDNDI